MSSKEGILSAISAYICGEMQVKHEIKSIKIFKWLGGEKVMRNLFLKEEIASLLAVKIRGPSRDFTASLSLAWVHTTDWLCNLNGHKANRCSGPCNPADHTPVMCYCESPSTSDITGNSFTPTFKCDNHTVAAMCLERFTQQLALIMFSALTDSSKSSRTCSLR